MKKSKLLIPLITLSGVAATVAPVMCLTSCAKGEVEEEHFKLDTESSKKALEVKTPEIVGQFTYDFICQDEKFAEEDAKLIDVTASITTTNSYITVLRCWKTYNVDTKTISATIAFSIDPAAFEYKEADPEKVEYSIIIHNGTWTQTEKGFSIKAIRNAKPE